jgi:hypothetical protein
MLPNSDSAYSSTGTNKDYQNSGISCQAAKTPLGPESIASVPGSRPLEIEATAKAKRVTETEEVRSVVSVSFCNTIRTIGPIRARPPPIPHKKR